MAASPRPIRFIMDHRIFRMPVLGWLFRLAKAIPIAPQKDDAAVYDAGLRARPRRCSTTATCSASFPRARSRATAQLRRVQGRRHEDAGDAPGAGRAARAAEPVGLVLLARRAGGRWRSRSGAASFSRVGLVAGEPVPASAVTPAGLRERVGSCSMLDDAPALAGGLARRRASTGARREARLGPRAARGRAARTRR